MLTLPLPTIIQSILTVFVSSIAIATSPITVPLPQDADYKELAANQIYGGNFSTDPTNKGRVLAETDETDEPAEPTPTPSPASLAVSVTKPPCPSNEITFRIDITNTGDRAAADIVIEDIYPNLPFIRGIRPPDSLDMGSRTVVWYEAGLAPGGSLTYTFTIRGLADRIEHNILRVSWYDTSEDPAANGPFQAIVNDSLEARCQPTPVGSPPPDGPYSPLPDNAQPVIICDPSETSCLPSRPFLGINFQQAKPPEENPQLGPRYQEAVADIIPGECRVVDDNIISTPEYQDALNRKSSAADAFIFPLFESGQDYKKMNHENDLLGIPFFIDAKKTLRKIHSDAWQKQTDAIQKVLDGTDGTESVRSQISSWNNDWITNTKNAQQQIAIDYSRIIQQRKQKFDPVANKAIANAQRAIQEACEESSDGGLQELLYPGVKEAYDNSQNTRLAAFSRMQDRFADPDNAEFPVTNRAATWQADLRSALDSFDSDDRAPLLAYFNSIGTRDQSYFETAWRLTYADYQEEDRNVDTQVRLENWEVALDAPKTVATDCEKEKPGVFGSHVITTWCESGTYTELLNAPALRNVRQVFLPNTSGLSTSTTIIPDVSGVACSKAPGDPWWAEDCSCQCGDLVPDGRGGFNTCESVKDIVRHDYFVTSQAECLSDRAGETGDPSF